MGCILETKRGFNEWEGLPTQRAGRRRNIKDKPNSAELFLAKYSRQEWRSHLITADPYFDWGFDRVNTTIAYLGTSIRKSRSEAKQQCRDLFFPTRGVWRVSRLINRSSPLCFSFLWDFMT